LLTYAIGRATTASDMPAVRAIKRDAGAMTIVSLRWFLES
jgi:hypothetical protein